MCRIFTYSGSSMDELNTLYGALKKSAQRDVLAEEAGMSFNRHPDGWGYVAITDKNKIYSYKNGNPIFEDDYKLPKMMGHMYAIFHARHATEKYLVAAPFNSPYLETTPSKVMYLVHNGRVNKKRMGRDLNYDGYLNVDCELISKHVVGFGMEKSMKMLEGYTESALNVIMMTYDRKSRDIDMYYKNYYIDKTKSEYYDMYLSKMPHGKALVSSTLIRYGISGKRISGDKLQLFEHAKGAATKKVSDRLVDT